MTASQISLYKRFRQDAPFMLVGCNAQLALSAAKTLSRFRELESQGLVRIEARPEEESYFSVYGEPDGYTNKQGHWVSAEQERKEICETLDRDGCWYVVAEYREGCHVEDCACPFHRDGRWQHADSVGMCTGYNDPTDPFENCYVIDLMREAVEKAEAELEEAN